MLAPIALLVGFALGQPANDNCRDATAITEGLYNDNTAGATIEEITRDFSPCTAYFSDVWFSYTASCTGVATAIAASTCDLVLAQWEGTCDGFTSHLCEDSGSAGGGETLFFDVEKDSTYLISVAEYSASCVAKMSLNLTCSTAPVNDECSSAVELIDGWQGGLTNLGATVGLPATSACPSNFHDVWFTYSAGCTGKTTVTISNPTSDLEIALWSGTDCGSLVKATCGDTGEARQPDSLTFDTVRTHTYYLSVAGYASKDFANFDATVTCVPSPPAPVNDECASPLLINDGSVTSSFLGATHSNGTSCGPISDVWLNYSASCNGTATVTVTPACPNDDLTLQMWSNCTTAASVCRDAGSEESVAFFAEKNKNYLFLAGTKSSPMCQSDFTISASCVPRGSPPINDQCEGAYQVGEGSTNAANAGATDSANPGCTMHSDVWFRYVANCTGTATASLDFLHDEVLTVWNGNCSTLSSRQCAHNGSVQFPTVKNSSYYISAGAFDVYQGPLLLILSCTAAATGAPTPMPTPHPTNAGCPDFKGFFLNCSATNFTDNARCSEACAQTVQHMFDGATIASADRAMCLNVVNATWNSSAAAAVLAQRLAAGSSLCRSGASELRLWFAPFVLLFITIMS